MERRSRVSHATPPRGASPRICEMVELVKKLKVDWTQIRFRVAAVYLIWRKDRPDDVFRIDRTLQLGDR